MAMSVESITWGMVASRLLLTFSALFSFAIYIFTPGRELRKEFSPFSEVARPSLLNPVQYLRFLFALPEPSFERGRKLSQAFFGGEIIYS